MIKWSKVKNFSNYSISTSGCVRNDLTQKIVKITTNRGYGRVGLYSNDRQNKKMLVHRLVAEAFLENPNKYPVVNHVDGNKLNNNLSNLEWCSISHNVKHSYSIGLSKPIPSNEKHHNSKLSMEIVNEIRLLYRQGMYQKDIAKKFGIIQQNVSSIVRGLTWKKIKTTKTGEIH